MAIHDDDLLQGMLSELAPSVLKKQEEEKLKKMWTQIDTDGNGRYGIIP